MPGGEDFKCGACGHECSTTSWLEYRLDDGTMAVLPHPGEDSTIKELGSTLERARDEGRLRKCEHWACNDCGRIHEHRFMIMPGKPWWKQRYTAVVMWGEVAVLAVLGVLLVLGRFKRFYSVVCPAASVMVLSWLVLAMVEARSERILWQDRWQRRPPARCPSCSSPNMLLPGEVVRGYRFPEKWPVKDPLPPSANRRLVCEKCGEAELEETGVWIS